MKIKMTNGRCGYCSQMELGPDISGHLLSCIKSPYKKPLKTAKGDEIFLIGVQSADVNLFWMFLEMKSALTPESLDRFLRKMWLECCGHLSNFTIGNIRYERYKGEEDDYDDDKESKTMKTPIDKILCPGIVFHHEYDYGTPTNLVLKAIASRKGMLQKAIKLIARNEPPAWKCTFCKNSATEVCGICGLDFKTIMCKNCLPKHKCGEETALPIVNSPRAGMCGYTG